MFNGQQFCIDYNIDYEVNRNGWLNINCPYCSTDRKFHGGINIYGGYFNCWKCGGKSLDYLIKTLLFVKTEEALSIIQDYDAQTQINQKLNKQEKKNTVSKINLIGSTLKKGHKKYLRSRGFDPEYLVDKYNITGTVKEPYDFKYRVIVPIYHNNKLISYQGRDVTGKNSLRWNVLSPEESVMHYKYTFYGLQFTSKSQIAVVEGIADQWKMGDGFVCSFGTALTTKQIKLLLNYDKVFFLFDSEDYTQEKAKRYAKLLQSIKNIEVENIDLELGKKDPGDLDRDEVKYIRRELGFV